MSEWSSVIFSPFYLDFCMLTFNMSKNLFKLTIKWIDAKTFVGL